MATYYVDYEGGNDANDGTTFANRWKTITNGATAARIAPGDTIRVMASPNPTSIGSATWTGGGRSVTPVVNIASSSNTTPIAITTSTDHGLSANDYVSVVGHTNNTNANGVWKVGSVTSSTVFTIVQMDGTNTTWNSAAGGATGTITKINNCVVKVSSPLTQNIALCGGLGQKPAWTASTNVTTSQEVTNGYKEGYSSANISIGASFTTGKAARYTLPSTLDLSGYQQVSFWINQTSGTIGAAGATYIALCSDTTGDTVVHTCNVPALGALIRWVPVTVDLGTNLNSAIKSVAFYVVTDNGAQTFLIDNIIACKASSGNDSLNLGSLISKSSGTGDESWYPIQSINYDVVMLGSSNVSISTSANIRGYNGTSETVTTYKREPIKFAVQSTDTAIASQINDSGSSGSLITFSGGWNRTDMSTQTGQTWYDGQNGNGYGISASSVNYVSIDRLNFCRYSFGVAFTATMSNCTIENCYSIGCATNMSLLGDNNTYKNLWANNTSNGSAISLNGSGNTIENIKLAANSSAAALVLSGADNYILDATLGNSGSTTIGNLQIVSTGGSGNRIKNIVSTNSAAGVYINGSITVNGGNTSGNTYGFRQVASGGVAIFNNFTFNETQEAFPQTDISSIPTVYSNRNDNTDGNNWIWASQGTINQQTSIVDSPATTSWKMSPIFNTVSATTPLALKLATVVCGANALVTVTARMRRSNTGLTMRLICPGGQIVGVANDVYTDMTAAADTWETVTITFTPTKAGGVNIYAQAFGGTTYNGYVCNVTASQA